MPLRPVLRLLLAGLLAGSVVLTPWPGGESDTPPLRVGYQVAHADGPGDWPMFGHDASQDLTQFIAQAPHGQEFLRRLPVVGRLGRAGHRQGA